MPEYTSYSQTWGALVSAAWAKIAAKLNIPDADEWKVSRVYAERGDYKVEWQNSDDADEPHEVTLYADGKASLDGGEECGIWPLHDRRWVTELTTAGVMGAIALFAVGFFQDLRKANPPYQGT